MRPAYRWLRMQASYLSTSTPMSFAKPRNGSLGSLPVCAHWCRVKIASCISQNLPCSPAHCPASAARREYLCIESGNPRKRQRTLPVAPLELELPRPSLRVLHDAAALGDLWRVVREPHFVMEQLAACVPEQLLQLRRRLEQAIGSIKLPDPLGQRAQQRHQPLRAL